VKAKAGAINQSRLAIGLLLHTSFEGNKLLGHAPASPDSHLPSLLSRAFAKTYFESQGTGPQRGCWPLGVWGQGQAM
jgi:hypothetical protein